LLVGLSGVYAIPCNRANVVAAINGVFFLLLFLQMFLKFLLDRDFDTHMPKKMLLGLI
jgi:hypothetical protein